MKHIVYRTLSVLLVVFLSFTAAAFLCLAIMTVGLWFYPPEPMPDIFVEKLLDNFVTSIMISGVMFSLFFLGLFRPHKRRTYGRR